MPRLCGFLLFSVAVLLPHTMVAQDKDKKPPDKKKAPIICTIELRDGTTLQGRYLAPPDIILESTDIGPLTFKAEAVRLLDCEAMTHRLGTYGFDTILGTVQTDEFTFRVLSTDKDVTFKRERIRRIVFPDPPRYVPLL